MRIALLAPLVSPIAPPFLGGAQALLADLASGLAGRGHTVTLYAADGSAVPGVETPVLGIDSSQLTPARMISSPVRQSDPEGGATTVSLDAQEDEGDEGDDEDEFAGGLMPWGPEDYLSDYAFLRAYRAIAEHTGKHDLVHSHAYDEPAFAYSSLQPLPVLHTLHLPDQDAGVRAVLTMIAPVSGPASLNRLVTVSSACAATYRPFCRIDNVIYNGVPIEQIPYASTPSMDSYLLYAGRISPEKGVEDALEIAEIAGKRLILAGGVYDQDYYRGRIEPRLSSRPDATSYLGAIPREHLWKVMGGAEAVLVPSHWDEPFGLVAVEAQAAGTPVIAYARGGLREVIADGVTGRLVDPDDIGLAAQAVAQVGSFDRAGCRTWVAERFSFDRMLDAYLEFYASMIGG
jgi:UDP-glucose:tetrahydrobiopterin glucosyltransferase